MATRTGHVGDHFEFTVDGHRLAGTDVITIDQVIRDSQKWRLTYHQYVSTDGYVMWAHAGREVAEAELPWFRPAPGRAGCATEAHAD